MLKKINDENTFTVAYKEKEITIVGTSHLSKDSVKKVISYIREIRPETVCVELCQARFNKIQSKNNWYNMDIVQVVKKGQVLLLLSSLLLESYQKRMGENIGLAPGQEMIEAISSAKEIGAQIELVDRELKISLLRTWRGMSFLSQIKITTSLLLSIIESTAITEKEIEEMKQHGMLESIISDLGKSMPHIKKVLIDERDQYLVEKIKHSEGNKILAFVGAGHVVGIEHNWNKNIDTKKLTELPPKGRLFAWLKWLVPIAVISLLVHGLYSEGVSRLANIASWWFVANCAFTGIGTTIALAHPITILASALIAPLTSLSPVVGAGWISGLVEASIRKPKVKDIENLSTDILSVTGFWKNRITRILLVVLFTNIGSLVGTIIAISVVI